MDIRLPGQIEENVAYSTEVKKFRKAYNYLSQALRVINDILFLCTIICSETTSIVLDTIGIDLLVLAIFFQRETPWQLNPDEGNKGNQDKKWPYHKHCILKHRLPSI